MCECGVRGRYALEGKGQAFKVLPLPCPLKNPGLELGVYLDAVHFRPAPWPAEHPALLLRTMAVHSLAGRGLPALTSAFLTLT